MWHEYEQRLPRNTLSCPNQRRRPACCLSNRHAAQLRRLSQPAPAMPSSIQLCPWLHVEGDVLS
jgi:hypothetical protein